MPTNATLARYESMITSLLSGAVARFKFTDAATSYARTVLEIDFPPTSNGGDEAPSSRVIHQTLKHYAARRIGEPPITPVPATPEPIPPTLAANGAAWIDIAWGALSKAAQPLRVNSRRLVQPSLHGTAVRLSTDTTAAGIFETLISNQQPAGHFLNPSANDNLESWWYAELVLLHAVGTYAAETDAPAAYRAAERAAVYHLNETQPDHATNEPWAIFPFLLLSETRSLADQLLHNANMMPPDGVALLLLADALYCLRKFTSRGTA
ncbi:MAG TPA: hypothetical protein VGN72_20040 [Tepidisphaeraceae bacterium]|jgi:hypothetical protein|nr:hypothetical protein [Tepidisphaeraceae bacterium]